MAQSALTVTPPSPTPPTNMPFHGASPPNVPNYTKATYTNPVSSPPPFLDVDASAAGALHTFATNAAASASGTGVNSGGTEGSYPGTGTAYANANNVGAVPAASSVAHEGAGTEVTVLAPGNITHTYPGGGTLDMSRSASSGLAMTAASRAAGPNATHASSLSPTTNPTIASISPNNIASGVGTQAITVTGANFTPQSVIYVNGVAVTTTFVSATSLTGTATKKTSAGTLPYFVRTGGIVETAPLNWTFT